MDGRSDIDFENFDFDDEDVLLEDENNMLTQDDSDHGFKPISERKSSAHDGSSGDEDEDQYDTHEDFMRAHPQWYSSLPPNPSPVDYIKQPVYQVKTYFRRMIDNFGLKFLIMLCCTYMGVKGFISAFLNVGQLPYFKEMGISGSRYQSFGTVASAPWAMKALFGAISDSIPIRGYHKKYYIVGSALFGTVSLAAIALVDIPKEMAALAALFFFFANVELAVVDLLCEGKYAEIMVKHPRTGSDIVSWVWGSFQIGSLMASCLIGPLADRGYIRGMYWICLPVAFQVIIPTMLNFLPEKKLPVYKRGVQTKKIKEHKKIFVLAIAMASCAICLALVNLFGGKVAIFAFSIFSAIFLCTLSFYVLPTMLAKCNFYLFLVSASYIQISGAVDYFYVADETCVPGGPQFHYTYYTTYSSIVQSIFGWIGVMVFQSVMSNWQFRHVFWVTICLKIFAGLVDIIIVKRWNLIVGIGDKWMYMMGYNIVYQIVGMMDLLAGVVLTSKLCPKNMESTVYALLAGFQNFGSGISRSIGVFLIEWLNIQTNVPCDFSWLPVLIFICHMCLPMLALPLTYILIPKARLTDTISTDEIMMTSVTSDHTHSHSHVDELELMNYNHVRNMRSSSKDRDSLQDLSDIDFIDDELNDNNNDSDF